MGSGEEGNVRASLYGGYVTIGMQAIHEFEKKFISTSGGTAALCGGPGEPSPPIEPMEAD